MSRHKIKLKDKTPERRKIYSKASRGWFLFVCFYFFVCLFAFQFILFEKLNFRERENQSFHHWFTPSPKRLQWPGLDQVRAGPGQSQGFPAVTWALRLSFCWPSQAIAGTWIGFAATRTQTWPCMECQHHRQWLNLQNQPCDECLYNSGITAELGRASGSKECFLWQNKKNNDPAASLLTALWKPSQWAASNSPWLTGTQLKRHNFAKQQKNNNTIYACFCRAFLLKGLPWFFFGDI